MPTDNENVSSEMETFTITFKINPSKYAERFGVEIPDDSADVMLTSEDESVVAEDAATYSFGPRMQQYAPQSSAVLNCKTTLQNCRAQNPMTCRFHGAKVVAQDIEAQIAAAFQAKGQQFNGNVNVRLDRIQNGVLNCTATITARIKDRELVKNGLDSFYKMPGVNGDTKSMGRDNSGYLDVFEIDMLNPQAKARWALGEAPQPGAQVAAPVAAAPAPAPTPAPAPAPAPAAPKRTRKRKMVAPKPEAAAPEEPAATPAEPVVAPVEPEPVSAPEPQEDDSGIEFPGEDEPVLVPGVAQKEPPPYNPPYTSAELDSLNNMAIRLLKTARQINKHIDEGKTDGWLQKTAPNLPKSLQKFKNEVNVSALQALAAKDTQGQVQPFLDLLDEISKSEASGWKTKVAESKWDLSADAWWHTSDKGNIDIHFDPKKYDDPYAKEREAFKNYKPGGESRKSTLESLKQVADSKSKDAPKDSAKEAKETSKVLDGLEKDYKAAKDAGASDDILKVFGQFYHKATKKFDEAVKKCKDWIGKQHYMRNTIQETIDGYKERGEEVPDQLLGWQAVEDGLEDKAWRYIASKCGLKVSDKVKCMSNFKKNMRKVALESICYTYQSDDWLANFIQGKELHGTKCNYAVASDKCFGTNFGIHRTHYTQITGATGVSSAQKKKVMHQMHLYSITTINKSHINSSGIIINNKKVVKGFFNENGNSASHLGATGQKTNGVLNPTLMTDANCTGLAYYYNPKTLKDLFEKDLTETHTAAQIFDKIGCGDENETWILGGLRTLDQAKEITFSHWSPYNANSFTEADKERCRKAGVKVYKQTGGGKVLLF